MSFHLKKSKKIENWPHGHVVGAKWCGRRCNARVVMAVVGTVPQGWWCEGLEGTTRKAVEITFAGKRFFVDYQFGMAIEKLTTGRGDPAQEFNILPVKYLPLYPQEPIERVYRAM
jgi:hypothetical protein